MSPAVKYSLGRVGIFVAVIVPVLVLVPLESLPLKLMIGIIVSAVVAFFALRRWREELAQQLTDGARRRQAEQQRLRSALAGEDDQPPPDAEPKGT